MAHNIIGALTCAAAGFLIAYVNYALSRKILRTCPEKFVLSTVVRQVVQVGYLAAVYLVGSGFSVNIIYLLAGAVIGMTVPMLFFTKKLVAFNESLAHRTESGEEDENG